MHDGRAVTGLEPFVCPACGAKLKTGRKRCLRCGRDLDVAREVSGRSPLAWIAAHQGRILIIACAASLIVLLGVVARTVNRAGSTAPPAAPPAALTATAQPEATWTAADDRLATDVPFLDARIGGTVAYQRGDYAAATVGFRNAIEANPNDADALNSLGQVLARTGKPAEAVPYLERAIQLYPNVWAYRFNLAHVIGQTGDWGRAVGEYRAARELFPDDYATQFNLATALHKQGKEEQAVTEYQKAITLAPGEPTFHLSLGISYEKLNRPGDAAEAYRHYLELAPRAPDAERVKARIQALTMPVPGAQAGAAGPPAHAGQG